ncbi:hypothetical protein ACFOET_10950 [Parapedobacter deserti]|uniref:Uncharacterized protein n=1 Tax=Parapedobacter deserti TaxID=1912957 RepID=A0ABV7JP58_9SPHI
MKVFELTSGFLAAVVVALGVNYYVKNNKVEEKPVVTDKTVLIQWFEYTGPELDEGDPNNQYDPHNPENYSPYQGTGTPNCTSGNQVCAIQVETDDSDPGNPIPDSNALQALAADIDNLTPRPGELMFKP